MKVIFRERALNPWKSIQSGFLIIINMLTVSPKGI